MKVLLAEVMSASISELDDLAMELAFEIESIERQLASWQEGSDAWRKRAIRARDEHKRTLALVRQRLDKLYFGEERMLHGAILAEIRRSMPISKFMDFVYKAKLKSGARA